MEYWFAAHETAKLAADVEALGNEFYCSLEQACDDDKIAKMCAFFAEQEAQHQTHFLAISEAHSGSDTEHAEHCYSVDICGMLRGSLRSLTELLAGRCSCSRSPATVLACLSLAAKVEDTSIAVYKRMLEQYASEFTDVLSEILADEQRHLQMINNVRHGLYFEATE